MKISQIIFLAFAAVFFSACAASSPKTDYSALMQTKPRSILVLMPTNETADVKASAAVAANAFAPLSELGYYVFPVALVNDTFKHNGISEPAEISQVPLNKLKEIFGADSALYLNVTRYGSTYKLIDSVTAASVSAKLVDLSSGVTLWQRSVTAQKNSSSSSGNLLGALISAAISQIADTISEAGYDMAVVADEVLFAPDCDECLLRGARSPKYGQDRQISGSK